MRHGACVAAVGHADPGVVDRAVRARRRRRHVGRIALASPDLEDGEPIHRPLARGEHVGLELRERHVIRHAEQRDLVDGGEAGQAGAPLGRRAVIAQEVGGVDGLAVGAPGERGERKGQRE